MISREFFERHYNKEQRTLLAPCLACEKLYAIEDLDPEAMEMYFTTFILIQDVFPNLNDDAREFLISLTCPTCWDRMFFEEDT